MPLYNRCYVCYKQLFEYEDMVIPTTCIKQAIRYTKEGKENVVFYRNEEDKRNQLINDEVKFKEYRKKYKNDDRYTFLPCMYYCKECWNYLFQGPDVLYIPKCPKCDEKYNINDVGLSYLEPHIYNTLNDSLKKDIFIYELEESGQFDKKEQQRLWLDFKTQYDLLQ